VDAEREPNPRLVAERERQLQLALSAARMGWWHYDPVSNISEYDVRFQEIFSLAGTDRPHHEILARMHPDDLPRVWAAVEAALNPAAPESSFTEYRIVLDDGSIRWVEAHGLVSFDGDGAARQAISFVGTVADVTDRKHIGDQARTILESITDAFFSLDRDWRFNYVNPQAERVLGRRPGDLLGKTIWEEFPGLPNSDFEPVYRKAMTERVAGSITSFYPDHDRWYEVRTYPVPNGISIYFRDVSEAKKTEEERVRLSAERERLLSRERAARSEAERTSRMKDEFLATLSHELRTPLNAILGWSQILAGKGRTDADLAEGLATIERNARAQTQIIEDLLDMSRIISGRVRLDVRQVDLASLVRAAADTLKPAADAKGVRLQVVLDPQAGPVNGDPNRLQQVFWNLLTNAVKFTPGGGRVQVLLKRVDSHLEVAVTDTGDGIKPDFLPYVFDRFRQSDASTTRRHGGLGLGLAIVKQLVELHGGTVDARSPGIGMGATFTISLPLTAIDRGPEVLEVPGYPKSMSLTVALDPTADITGIKVLVVDDEPDSKALLKRLLEDCSAIVTVAASAEEAITRLQADRPDVLVSDIGMPGEDGYGLIRRVRSLAPDMGGGTPALALTAYAREEDRTKAIAAGFQYHVAKPVEPAELIAMVANLAGRTQKKEPAICE
jgi:PAS domain S-box-containing protein